MSPRPTSTSSSSRIVTDCGGKASSSGRSKVSTAATRVRRPGRQHDDLVARPPGSAGDLPRVAAVVVVVVRHRPDHPLHREAAVVEVAVAGELDALEVLEQGRAVVPGQAVAALDDVVAAQRRHRDRARVVQAEPVGERLEVAPRSRRSARPRSRPGPSCSPRRRCAGSRASPRCRSGGASARRRPCARRAGSRRRPRSRRR